MPAIEYRNENRSGQIFRHYSCSLDECPSNDTIRFSTFIQKHLKKQLLATFKSIFDLHMVKYPFQLPLVLQNEYFIPFKFIITCLYDEQRYSETINVNFSDIYDFGILEDVFDSILYFHLPNNFSDRDHYVLQYFVELQHNDSLSERISFESIDLSSRLITQATWSKFLKFDVLAINTVLQANEQLFITNFSQALDSLRVGRSKEVEAIKSSNEYYITIGNLNINQTIKTICLRVNQIAHSLELTLIDATTLSDTTFINYLSVLQTVNTDDKYQSTEWYNFLTTFYYYILLIPPSYFSTSLVNLQPERNEPEIEVNDTTSELDHDDFDLEEVEDLDEDEDEDFTDVESQIIPKSIKVNKKAITSIDLSAIPDADKLLDETETDVLAQDPSLLADNIEKNLEKSILKSQDDELARLSFKFKLYDPGTRLSIAEKRKKKQELSDPTPDNPHPIDPSDPSFRSKNKITIDQIYAFLQNRNILTKAIPPNNYTFHGKKYKNGKQFVLKYLLQIVTHNYFQNSHIHKIICQKSTYNNGLRQTSKSCADFLLYRNELEKFINPQHMITYKIFKDRSKDDPENKEIRRFHTMYMKFYKAIFFYFSRIFYARQLNEYYYYFSVNRENKPSIEPTPDYSGHENENFIPGKLNYRCDRSRRLFIKECKKNGILPPNPKATESSRLTVNKKLLEVRAILNDNRDFLSTILQDLYTDDNFLTMVPYLINKGTIFTKSGRVSYFNISKITLLLYLYYIDNTVTDPALKKTLIDRIVTIIKTSGVSADRVRAKNPDNIFDKNASPTSSLNAYFSNSTFGDFYALQKSFRAIIDANINDKNYIDTIS